VIKQDQVIQNRYRIIRLLGSGGFGSVYQAEDTRLGRVVALKEMDAARLGPDERAVAEQLFEREARTLASLDHPNLTRIWDYFEDERRAYLVMEYVPGQTLRDLVQQRGGPLDEGFVLEFATQVSAVLSYLHTRQPPLIFRDLKPANVMVVSEIGDGSQESGVGQLPTPNSQPPAPRFVLIDFGIARFFKPEQPGDTLIIGTPGYAPPEQYGRGQTDQRSDIYGLGATMFHLLSGQAPASVPPPPLGSANPRVSPELARVVARATALEPADRYPSAEDLRKDVLAITRSRGLASTSQAPRPAAPSPPFAATPRADTPPPPVFAPRPRRSYAVPLGVLALVVLAIVGLLAARGLGRLGGESGAAQPTPQPQPTIAPAAREWQLPDAPGTIAFGQRDQNGFNVWAATLDGAPPHQLTNDGRTYGPAWSADGRRIGVTRDENGRTDVYLGNADNPLAQRVDIPGRQARYPAWSPDGRRIAMASSGDGGQSWQITVVDGATGALTLLDTPFNVGGVTWAPGGQLVFAGQPAAGQPQDIFTLGDDGVARNLTNTPDVEEDFPAWSPDGRRIAFAASPPGRDNLPQRQIFSIDADGGGRTQLTSGPGPHTNPVWSPDGSWIAYLAQETSADWQVWAMRADGGEPRQVTFGAQRKFYLAWGNG
jgi:serine/threonine protein kinase